VPYGVRGADERLDASDRVPAAVRRELKRARRRREDDEDDDGEEP